MKHRVLAAGYFGCGNLGDDALLLALSEGLGKNYEVSALSGNPEETYRNFGIIAHPRREFDRIRQALAENDALVFPGGSVFQDVTSVKSAMYYAKLVSEAKKAKKKVIMVGQGVGPLTTFIGKRVARAAFEAADAIAVRDQESAKVLHTLGVAQRARVTADLAFLLSSPPSGPDETPFQVGDMRTIGLAPRPHGKTKEIVELFGELAHQIFQAGFVPVMIEMDTKEDKPILDAIEKERGGKIPSVRKVTHPVDMQRRLKRMEAVIAMRLHAGILATTVRVPSIMMSYDPKVTAFANDAGLPNVPVSGATPARVLETLQKFLKDREKNVERLSQRAAELRTAAAQNIEIIQSILA